MKSTFTGQGAAGSVITGGGEMGALMQQVDWSATSVGKPEHWPLSLKTTLRILLNSSFPMFLFWGDELLCFYNDAYRPSLGQDGKHPAVGKPAQEVWPETWGFIGPLIDQVRATQQPVWFEDQFLPIFRNGKLEDVYWTFSYSPAYDDRGAVAGVFVTCTETTEKVKITRMLIDSEKRFQTLVREATLGIVVLSGTGLVVELTNKAYAAMVDRSIEELTGRPLFDVIPEAAPLFRPIIEQVLAAQEPVSLPAFPIVYEENGQEKSTYLNLIYQPFRDDDNATMSVMVLCQDVTEQVIARKRVEESEQRVRSLVESTPFPIGVYVGREMRIALANQAIIDVWGKGNDVIGRLYPELLPELQDSGIFEQLQAVYQDGIPFHAKNQRVDIEVDGKLSPFYFNYSFTPLYNAEGEIYGVMNTAADVSDLHFATERVEESRRNLRNIILKAPVAMAILNGPGFVVEIANEKMITIWGKDDGVINKPLIEALPEIRGQGFLELLEQVYTTGEAHYGYATPVQLARGEQIETIYCNFIYEAYRESQSEISGIIVVAVDVTEQVLAIRSVEQSELELLDIKARLEVELDAGKQLQKQKDDFIGIASHELKTPLTALKSSMQLLGRWLREENAAPRVAQLINLSNNSVNKLGNLLEELLNDTKINEGQLVLNKTAFNLDELLNECIDHFRMTGSHEIVIRGDRNVPVFADRQRIDQVVINLLNNAIKYAPQSKVIAVHIERSDADVRVAVVDTGPGIPPEKLPHLFKRYYRVDTSGIQYSGLGLGLFIVAEIIRRHGGGIGVNSTLHEGSEFWFTIPVSGA